MTNENAKNAKPGDRFTDPDGGTWVLRFLFAESEWFEFTTGGHLVWRSQEEAEAANLVPLVAETELAAAKAAAVAAFDGNALIQAAHAERDHFQDAVHELCEAIRLTVEYVGPKMLPAIDGWSWFDALVKYAPETAQAFVQARFDRNQQAVEAVQRAERDLREGKAVGVEVPAAPAPLDPGNPEHLRQVANVLGQLTPRALGVTMTPLDGVLRGVRSLADRLDRERAEAEQDRKDRELATEIAKTERHDFGLLAESYREEILRHILAGIRAGRVERQEAGQ